MQYYEYCLADGGSYLFATELKPAKIKELFIQFKKTVRNPSYWDSNKFLPYLRKQGYKAELIITDKEHTIISY